MTDTASTRLAALFALHKARGEAAMEQGVMPDSSDGVIMFKALCWLHRNTILAALSTAQASERKQIAALAIEDAVAKHGSIVIEPMGDGLGWAATDSDSEDRIWHPLSVARSEPSPVDVERASLAEVADSLRDIPDEMFRRIADAKDVASCRSRIAVALKYLAALQSPPVEQPAQAEAQQPSDGLAETEGLENLIRFHESGGHLGDGSDIALQVAKMELAALKTRTSPETEASDGLVEELEFELSSGRVEQYYARLAISKAITALKTRTSPETVELLREAREPRVFLDCDGVLADFDKAGEQLWGMPPRAYEAKVGSNQFWCELEQQTDFYGTLPLMPDAMELFEGVKHLHPTILTGCPRGDWAQGQKIAWAARHFPGVPIITCRSADKRDYAKPGDVLIDDWPQHRHRWIEMGGVFINHHDAATSLAALWAHYPALRIDAHLSNTPGKESSDG